jgi:hypothetical protein
MLLSDWFDSVSISHRRAVQVRLFTLQDQDGISEISVTKSALCYHLEIKSVLTYNHHGNLTSPSPGIGEVSLYSSPVALGGGGNVCV